MLPNDQHFSDDRGELLQASGLPGWAFLQRPIMIVNAFNFFREQTSIAETEGKARLHAGRLGGGLWRRLRVAVYILRGGGQHSKGAGSVRDSGQGLQGEST